MKIRNRKSRLQRALDSGLPDIGSGKGRKAGLIAAGSLAGLTAASAGISSLRRQRERASRA
jgi:hypothetical protein